MTPLRWYKRVLPICLAMTISFSSLSYAATLDDLQKQKQDKVTDIQQNVQKVHDIAQEKDKLYDEMAALDLQIADLQDQINKMVDEIDALDKDIKQAETDIDRMSHHIESRTEDFKKRVRAMYVNSQMGNLEILLSSEDLSSLLSRASMMKFVTEHDVEILNDLKHSRLEIDAKKAELAGKKAAAEIAKAKLDEKNAQMQATLAQKHQKADALTQDMIATQEEITYLEAVVSDLDHKIQDEKDRLERERQKALEEQRRRAEAKLMAAREAQRRAQIVKTASVAVQSSYMSYSTGQGSLGWPVPSSHRITSYYGIRNNPFGGSGLEFHTGVDIAAAAGSPIVAADSGTIIHTAYTGSYGNLVKLQHDSGIVTYYAHCSAFVAHVGQRVNRGDVIALIGTTGNSTGPHLHFEVRINGAHTDPLRYIR